MTERGARLTSNSEINTKTLQWVTDDCRRFILSKADVYRFLSIASRKNVVKDLIVSYVIDLEFNVDGFIDTDGKVETMKLVDSLVDAIQNYGILTNVIDDTSINEIRSNERELWIEQRGRSRQLKDENGVPVLWESPEQQDTILRKFLGDVRISQKYAIVNARTIEGYRLAAVDRSCVGDDPENPNGDKFHVFVLRKFKKQKMGLPEIAKFGTMSDDMARFLSIIPEGGLTFFTCGPTASGKSTTNNAILMSIPIDIRLVLVQSPSEIDGRIRDEYGMVLNDVIHLEYKDIDKHIATANDATSENITTQVLRLSPTLVVFGEWRDNHEFKRGMQIAQAGHPINTTLHSSDAVESIGRVLSAYLAESGNEPADLALSTITRLVDIVIIQKILRDGTRKVLQIAEILGVNPDKPNEPLVNDLYVFETDGKVDYNPDGTISRIGGKHKRVGQISSQLLKKLSFEGVTKERVDFLLDAPDKHNLKEETYTGVNINGYNKFMRKDA